jgi:hypothetical protein
MSPRRTAADAARPADSEPVRCFCGAAEFDYAFSRFPMTHVSRCRNCGLEHRCALKITPARRTATQPPEPPAGFPPFWI